MGNRCLNHKIILWFHHRFKEWPQIQKFDYVLRANLLWWRGYFWIWICFFDIMKQEMHELTRGCWIMSSVSNYASPRSKPSDHLKHKFDAETSKNHFQKYPHICDPGYINPCSLELHRLILNCDEKGKSYQEKFSSQKCKQFFPSNWNPVQNEELTSNQHLILSDICGRQLTDRVIVTSVSYILRHRHHSQT